MRIDMLQLRQRDDRVHVSEHVVHFFEGSTFRLREEEEEDDSVGETADGEDEVVFPAW